MTKLVICVRSERLIWNRPDLFYKRPENALFFLFDGRHGGDAGSAAVSVLVFTELFLINDEARYWNAMGYVPIPKILVRVGSRR